MKVSHEKLYYALVTLLSICIFSSNSIAIPIIWGVWDWTIEDPVQIMVTPEGNGTPFTAADFFGDYNFRSDFFWDGVLNLSDVGRFSAALGGECD